MKTACALLVLFLFFAFDGYTQQYSFVSYTPSDGLASNRVHTMCQDRLGRLYFGTFGGLSVYDGSRFVNYTASEGLGGNIVNDIVEMGDDSLWIVPNDRCVYYLKGGQLRRLHIVGACPVINSILKATDGSYYALSDEGLFRWEKDRFVKKPMPLEGGQDYARNFYQGVAVGPYLFLNTDIRTPAFKVPHRFYVYDTRCQSGFTDPLLPFVHFVGTSPEGNVLLATAKGLRKANMMALARKRIELQDAPPELHVSKNTLFHLFYFDRQGNLWLSADNGILRIRTDGASTLFDTPHGLSVQSTSFVFQDRENTIWLGNEVSGVSKLVNPQLQYLKTIYPEFHVTDISEDLEVPRTWWFDRPNHRALAMCHNKEKTFLLPPHLQLLRCLMKGAVGFGTDSNNLYLLRAGQGRINAAVFPGYPGIAYGCTTLLEDCRRDKILISNKVVMVDRQNRVHSFPLDNLADQACITDKATLWVLSRSGSVYCFNLMDTCLQPEHCWQLPPVTARSFTVDGQGHLWVGTRSQGLYCFQVNGRSVTQLQHLSQQQGLTENFVRFLVCDGADNIWACTAGGLDLIRAKRSTIYIDNITRSARRYLDVMKLVTDHSGVVWAVSTSGILRVDPPFDTETRYRPSLLCQMQLANGLRFFNVRGPLVLSYDQNNLSFHLAATSFIEERETRYSFFLAGSSQKNWSAPSHDPDIHFANLSPGNYQLMVRANFLNGAYPPENCRFSFVIQTPWWQRSWVKTAEILFACGAVFLLLRLYYRSQWLKQQRQLEKQQAIEQERTRIALDMHDELGSGLSRIKFLSETMRRRPDGVKEDDLKRIAGYSDEMVSKMGEIVWALNQSNDTLVDLIGYIRAYAVEYCEQHQLSCAVEVRGTGGETVIRGETRRHIFLCVKEILHNTVKHAAASQVRITIRTGKSLEIIVHDNGTGIGAGSSVPRGNGIGSIRNRMQEVGGTAIFEGGEGTRVILVMPLYP